MMKIMRVMCAGLVGIVAAVLFAVTLTHAVWYDLEIEMPVSAQSQPIPTSTAAGTPARLIIPLLHIDAPVEHVGFATPRRMASPRKFSDAGWFKYGPAPGDPGAAVILGHLDNGLGQGGVFKRLHELMPGDEIDVLTADDRTLRFRVTSLKSYPYDRVPPAILASEGTRLLLVTCAGHWIYSASQGMTYDRRLIVFATPMNG